MTELIFVGKRRGTRSVRDVSVFYSETTNSGKTSTTYFTFRNNCWDKIAPSTNCTFYAVSGTRVYFKEAKPSEGFHLNSNSNNKVNNKYISVSGEMHRELHDWAKENEGGYDLCYDTRLGLWCIDTNGVILRGMEK